MPTDNTPQEGSFGAYLKRLRTERRLTLRDVEKITNGKVSNAYLSQLEGDRIAAPSVLMLHRLSAALGVDFAVMCERACVGDTPTTRPAPCPVCGRPFFGDTL